MAAVRIVQFDDFPGRDLGRITALSFGPEGRTLAAVWRIEENIIIVRWWDLGRDEEIASDFGTSLAEDDVMPPNPALSPDHRFLARLANERGGVQWIQFFDRESTKPRDRPLTAWPYTDLDDHPECFNYQNVDALQFSPDGQYLVAAIGGGDPDDEAADLPRVGLYRWSVSAILRGRGAKSGGRLLPDATFFLPMPRSDVFHWPKFGRALAFAPDCSALVAGLWYAQILSWEIPPGRALSSPRLKKRKLPRAWRLTFSPDGRTLAVADETVTLYDKASSSVIAVLPPGPRVVAHESHPPSPTVFDLEFHPSGRLLAMASGDALLRTCDGTNGAERGALDCGIGPVTAVTFSLDGRLGAAGGEGGQVAIWEP